MQAAFYHYIRALSFSFSCFYFSFVFSFLEIKQVGSFEFVKMSLGKGGKRYLPLLVRKLFFPRRVSSPLARLIELKTR